MLPALSSRADEGADDGHDDAPPLGPLPQRDDLIVSGQASSAAADDQAAGAVLPLVHHDDEQARVWIQGSVDEQDVPVMNT